MNISNDISTGIVKSSASDFLGIIALTGVLSAAGQYFENRLSHTGIAYLSGKDLPVISSYFPPDRFKLIFGDNATQTIDSIIIQKSDLTGLLPSSINTAESLLVGILSKVLSGKSVVEIPGLTFTYWGYGFTASKRVDTVLVDARNKLTLVNTYEIPEISTIIDPDNY